MVKFSVSGVSGGVCGGATPVIILPRFSCMILIWSYQFSHLLKVIYLINYED